MASVENITTMDSFFKEVYAEGIKNLVPDHEMLLKEIPFVGNDSKNGGNYIQPVVLTREHGISYLGNDESTSLASPVISVKKDAAVAGAIKVMRTQVSGGAVSRAVKGKRAFVSATNWAIESLTKSMGCKQESSHWYGDSGFARFTATTADLGNDLVTLVAGQFAPALWIGGEGMPVDIYSVSGSTDLDKVPNALVATSPSGGTRSITKVDFVNRQITLSDVTGMSDSTEYFILPKGQKGYDSKGMFQILKNSGSLFGIDAATYPLWLANQYDVGGNLNYAKVADAVSLAMGRGLRGPIDLTVHSSIFQQLFPDFLTLKDTSVSSSVPAVTTGPLQAAYTKKESKSASRSFGASDVRHVVHGTDKVTFYVNGVMVNVRSNEYVLPSLGAGIDMNEFMRVGSSEIIAGTPGESPDRVWFTRPDDSAVEFRLWSDQALFTRAPSMSLLLWGIS